MTRGRMLGILGTVAVAVFVAWIANHTYWADTTLPLPPTGEALTNPFYLAQRFTDALGARGVRDEVFGAPSTESVLVLGAWHWDLSPRRRGELERWVESGGRLVVDATLVNGLEFEQWTGVLREFRDPPDDAQSDAEAVPWCRSFVEERHGSPAGRYQMCGADEMAFLTSRQRPEWDLRDSSGMHAVRVRVGQGSVTVIDAVPFRDRSLLRGEHGQLFVAATELRRADVVHFLSEDAPPSLLALSWQRGGPVVAMTLLAIALGVWRVGPRFGPLVDPPEMSRRSLAEQIRGSGQFALRYSAGDGLHGACVRAVDEAAARRLSGYGRLSSADRVAALARLSGLDRGALAAAIHHPGQRTAHQLRHTIALLETARRRILTADRRFPHDTHRN